MPDQLPRGTSPLDALPLAMFQDHATTLLVERTCAATSLLMVRLPSGDWRIVAAAGELVGKARVDTIVGPQPLRTALADGSPLGNMVWVPVHDEVSRAGWLAGLLRDPSGRVVAGVGAWYHARSAVTDADLELAEQLTERLQRAMSVKRRLALIAEVSALRLERVHDRELHDQTLQTLYAAGLDLGRLMHPSAGPDVTRLVERSLARLDDLAEQLREALRARPEPGTGMRTVMCLEQAVLDVVPVFGFVPRLEVEGAEELEAGTLDAVLHTLADGLSMLAMHRSPNAVAVRVLTTSATVVVELEHGDAPLPELSSIAARDPRVAHECLPGTDDVHRWTHTR